MDQEMKDNLQDLRDIRKQMDQYYGIGQEYIRKEQIFERYEKAKKKWDLENKKKYMIISVVAGVLFGFPGLMLGVLVAAGIYFFYDKISAEKQRLCDEMEDELNAILKRYQEKYTPVAEKCERLLLNKDEYAVPMSVDYLIQMIETGRVNTMNEAYDKLDITASPLDNGETAKTAVGCSARAIQTIKRDICMAKGSGVYGIW